VSALAEPAIARHVVREIRSSWRQEGWRIFLSDKGRWWATTTTKPITLGSRYWEPRHTVMATDAVDADEYTELAARLDLAMVRR
jgi:hypothetical protein